MATFTRRGMPIRRSLLTPRCQSVATSPSPSSTSMSQPHTHGPGQPPHTHSHGPPQPQPPQPQPQMVARPPDPVMLAVIEASIRPVDITLGPPNIASALCPHDLEKCAECDVDHTALNRVSRLLVTNPNLRCPPPPQLVSQKLSQVINNTKEEGNTLFKGGLHEKAIQRYTMAINIALQRPSWEAQQIMREELSTIMSNRSAALLEAGDYIGALVDAEVVVQLKRPWSKGHFRKARALLKLDRLQEAKEAIELALSFEPDNQEMVQMLAGVEQGLQQAQLSRQNIPPPLPIS
ncbi:hypothetical protein B0H21DRAFT_747817 [Amylocystis lapponica]|nr:hypothetical protein B0H21DRAFT_747817 [Amylocystis lapponica]